MNVVSFTDFEASFVFYLMIKLAKMPQTMKSSKRFLIVFDSAILCQLFQAPYSINSELTEANSPKSAQYAIDDASRPRKQL